MNNTQDCYSQIWVLVQLFQQDDVTVLKFHNSNAWTENKIRVACMTGFASATSAVGVHNANTNKLNTSKNDHRSVKII